MAKRLTRKEVFPQQPTGMQQLKRCLKENAEPGTESLYNGIQESQCISKLFNTGLNVNVTFNQSVTYRGQLYKAANTYQMDKVHAQIIKDAGVDVTVSE